MNRSTPLLILLAVTLILGITACGETTEAVSENKVSKEAIAKPAYNPLAAEQQLIRDAEALQGVLDKDAARKKQAIKDAN